MLLKLCLLFVELIDFAFLCTILYVINHNEENIDEN